MLDYHDDLITGDDVTTRAAVIAWAYLQAGWIVKIKEVYSDSHYCTVMRWHD